MSRSTIVTSLLIVAIGLFVWFVPAERPDRETAGSIDSMDALAATESAQPSTIELTRPEASADRGGGSQEGASTEPSPPKESAAKSPRVLIFPIVDLPSDVSPHSFELPRSLDRWLANPALNSEGYVACDAEAEEHYSELVNDVQEQMVKFKAMHFDLSSEVGERKVRESVDLAERGTDFPEDAILRFSTTQIDDGAIKSQGTTFVRRGDSPELDAVDFELRVLVADFIVQSRRIASNGCTK